MFSDESCRLKKIVIWGKVGGLVRSTKNRDSLRLSQKAHLNFIVFGFFLVQKVNFLFIVQKKYATLEAEIIM
jgi:hypothetical protein